VAVVAVRGRAFDRRTHDLQRAHRELGVREGDRVAKHRRDRRIDLRIRWCGIGRRTAPATPDEHQQKGATHVHGIRLHCQTARNA
jgi:hypothetical protein